MSPYGLAIERADGTHALVPAHTLDSIRTLTAKGLFLRIAAETDGLPAAALDTERHPNDDPHEVAAALTALIRQDLIEITSTPEATIVFRAVGLEVTAP